MENLESLILQLLEKQGKKHHHIPLDIVLWNGNILLKSFRLYAYDEQLQQIKGMTMQEEYAYLRENREAVFAYFFLYEIRAIEKAHSNYIFLEGSIHEDTPKKANY